MICSTFPIWSTLEEEKKFPEILPSWIVKLGYFLFAPFIQGLLPVVDIIKVSSGLRFRTLLVFPLPDSPTIAISSAIYNVNLKLSLELVSVSSFLTSFIAFSLLQ